MTVRELRKALDTLPDDYPVLLYLGRVPHFMGVWYCVPHFMGWLDIAAVTREDKAGEERVDIEGISEADHA